MAEDGKIVYKVSVDDDEAVKDAQNSAEKIADSFEDASKKQSEITKKQTDATGQAAKALAAQYASSIASTISQAGISVLKYGTSYNMSIENLSASFETLLGSTDKAKAKMEELRKYAAETPFSLNGISEATKTLLSFQVPAEETQGILEQLGDISLGNEQKLQGLALVFGQVSSAGRLTGQDLMQFINQGFNPLNYIAQRTGESMEELRDRMSKGGVSVDEVKQAFVDATSAGGQFYKGTEKGAQTTAGRLSTLKDNFAALAGQITEGLIPILQTLVDWGIALSNWASEHSGLLSVLGAAVIGITVAFAGLSIALKLIAIQGALAAVGLGAALAPILLVTAGIAALIAVGVLLIKNWDSIISWGKEAWGGFSNWLSGVFDSMGNFFSGLWDRFKAAMQSVIDFVKSNWQALLLFLVNPIAGAVALLYNLNPKFREWANNVAQTIKDGIGRAIDWIKGLPGQAFEWGADFMSGMAKGIMSFANSVIESVRGIANKIRGLLHFSRPDYGPLRDYETWMPDFMHGLARGIKSNAYKVDDAMMDLSQGMVLPMGHPDIPTTTSVASDVGKTFSATLQTSGQTINVPVYLNGREIARASAWNMGEQLAWEEL